MSCIKKYSTLLVPVGSTPIQCFSCCFLVFALSALQTAKCQERKDAGIPVFMSNVTTDSESRKISFGIENRSRHEITAFAYRIEVLQPTGERFTQPGSTDATNIFSIRSLAPVKYPQVQSFKPGESYPETAVAPPSWGDLRRASIVARPTAVIFDDCTSVGDTEIIRSILASRELDARQTTPVLEAVGAIPRDSAFAGRLEEVSKRFSRRASTDQRNLQGQLLAQIAGIHNVLGFDGVDKLIRVRRAQAVANAACPSGGGK